MIERWESDDPRDARLALGSTGLLREFNAAGVLTAADVHVATRTAELVGESADDVRLAFVGAPAPIEILPELGARNGRPVKRARSIRVRRGEVVQIGSLTGGAV